MFPSLKKSTIYNRFFFKSLLRNLVLTLVPLCIICIFSLYQLNQSTKESLETRNWNLMYQIKTQADSMFETSNSITNLLTNTPAISTPLIDAFSDENLSRETIESLNTVSTYYTNILGANPYAYSSFLYLENDFGRYVASSGERSYIQTFAQHDWLNEYLTSPQEFWLETTSDSLYSSRFPNMIAVYDKFYLLSSASTSGILATYYSCNKLQEHITTYDLYDGQFVFFIQENHDPLFQSSDEDLSNIWSVLSPHIKTGNDYAHFTINHNNEHYVVNVISSSLNNFYYVSMVPHGNLYANSHLLIALFLLIAGVLFLLCLFLSFHNSKHEYEQLQTIIDIFDNPTTYIQQPYEHPAQSNPYQAILYNVINLFLSHNYLKLQNENKQYQLQLMELQSLQRQINPHFLFNTLNTIYWEAIRLTGEPNPCTSMISDLSEIMTYSLGSTHEETTIADELNYLQHYLNIQKIRYNLEVQMDIDEDSLDCSIIRMILQPLVENSIYHGIKEKSSPGIIKIKIYHQEQIIRIHILDNGKGISPEHLQHLRSQLHAATQNDDHIGLLNTNRRLTLTYGQDSAIRLSSHAEVGTIVSFSIPAKRNRQE